MTKHSKFHNEAEDMARELEKADTYSLEQLMPRCETRDICDFPELKEDELARAQMLAQCFWMTLNQKLKMQGLPEVDDPNFNSIWIPCIRSFMTVEIKRKFLLWSSIA